MESVAYDGAYAAYDMTMESTLLARVRCSIISRFSGPFINSAISIMCKSKHSFVENRLLSHRIMGLIINSEPYFPTSTKQFH